MSIKVFFDPAATENIEPTNIVLVDEKGRAIIDVNDTFFIYEPRIRQSRIDTSPILPLLDAIYVDENNLPSTDPEVGKDKLSLTDNNGDMLIDENGIPLSMIMDRYSIVVDEFSVPLTDSFGVVLRSGNPYGAAVVNKNNRLVYDLNGAILIYSNE